jgi:uncharacterized protein YggU (UPF0235/DUF167 family)
MYLRITVVPGAKKESLQKLSENKWLISVKEPAEHNLANTRVCTLIARERNVAPSDVRILTGHHSRVKMISVLT